jgi:AcrR family transcriptional regulator
MIETSKKRKIYQAAAKIFAQEGFDGTSLDAIALKAKVAKGTIFYYFKNKEELFSALLEEGVLQLAEKIAAINASDQEIRNKLNELIEFHLTFFQKYSNLCLMVLNQAGHFQNRWKKGFALIGEKYFKPMGQLISAGKKQGIINPRLETESIIISLFSLVAVSSADWALFHQKVSREKMIETMRSIIFHGLLKPAK